jgi:hypothetical protein
MSADTLTGAALVEAVARGIDAYANPYTPPRGERHMLHAPHARAGLRAAVASAGVDERLLSDAEWWLDDAPKLAPVARLLRALAEVVRDE